MLKFHRPILVHYVHWCSTCLVIKAANNWRGVRRPLSCSFDALYVLYAIFEHFLQNPLQHRNKHGKSQGVGHATRTGMTAKSARKMQSTHGNVMGLRRLNLSNAAVQTTHRVRHRQEKQLVLYSRCFGALFQCFSVSADRWRPLTKSWNISKKNKR